MMYLHRNFTCYLQLYISYEQTKAKYRSHEEVELLISNITQEMSMEGENFPDFRRFVTMADSLEMQVICSYVTDITININVIIICF